MFLVIFLDLRQSAVCSSPQHNVLECRVQFDKIRYPDRILISVKSLHLITKPNKTKSKINILFIIRAKVVKSILTKMDFRQRSVLVLGGAGGIGKEICVQLIHRGVKASV